VDDLLAQGVSEVTVLDLSSRALAAAKARLSEGAERVTWIEADVTAAPLPSGSYDLWHDRAVFHFLTQAEDRRRYVDAMRHALKPGGQAILATFALDGPPRCSGLEVVRYSPDTLRQELGSGFQLAETVPEAHQTPFHTTQRFVYNRFLRLPD
jgi:SAM-dependent methyltransferase